MYIKKSLLVMFITSILQLWTNKTKTFKNQKNQKRKKVTFSDFYCLIINTKF